LKRSVVCALLLVTVALGLVACGDSGEDSESPARSEAAISGTDAPPAGAPDWVASSHEAAQSLERDEGGRGLPIKQTRCIPQSEGGSSQWTQECEVEYIYGPPMSCEIALTESGEVGASRCVGSGESGDWYRDCKASGAGSKCDQLARRQLDSCAGGGQDRRFCLEAVYGKKRD